MDPQQLRTFVTVVRLASFSAAARELGYTQSAVSQQIAALEQELRAPLLQRRPVAPTEAGARLLEHAPGILLRLDAARADVARVGGSARGLLRVAVTALAAPRPLAQALAATRHAFPRAELAVSLVGREAAVTAVAAGEADVAVVDGVAAPSDPLALPAAAPVSAVPVAQRRLAVLLPVGHPLEGRRRIRLASLQDAFWLDAPDAAVPLAELRGATGSDAFPPSLALAGPSVGAVTACVAARLGLAVVPVPGPFGGEGPPGEGVVAVPLADGGLLHRTEAVWSGARTGVVEHFVAGLEDTGSNQL
ncbi:LysR family transcriptional regulator [Streptacidiphilus anmyonensis]|uniref:LysR family transcriptional regulator n=1 Tax=Streptacidiphilus anmyonensis TaxID=405782 RepID=UPI0005A91656|nr:LysR family transcriptional regulator [Streptacidiphilus anmyonensis]